MEIGNYYFSKTQSITLAILVIGLFIGLVLVQRQQVFKSRASFLNKPFEVIQNAIPQEPAICQGNTCITKSLNVIIKPAGLGSLPSSAIPAKIIRPAPKATAKPYILPSVGYYIPFRDSSVRVANPAAVKNRVLNSFPKARIENWDNIVSQSIANGWNPAFVLTLWIEESGAQGYPGYSDALGCDPSNPTTDINKSLGCLFRSFGSYGPDKFQDFMCMYGGDGFHKAPCTFNVSNPNFPRNVGSIYTELVPGGLGAIVK